MQIELQEFFSRLVMWWGHWNVFIAADLCAIGVGYCLWRTRTASSLSKVAAAGVVSIFVFSLAAGATATNQVLADVKKMDIEAQAQSEHPIFHKGWWYATSGTAGPQWTQAFRTREDCEEFVTFSRGVPFVCGQTAVHEALAVSTRS